MPTALCLVLGAELPASALWPITASNLPPPAIHFAAPVYDFGRVASGGIVRHDFLFTNTGKALLEISNVQTSCGCTTAGAWPRQTEPGKTGIIPIQFHAGSYGGPVAKVVRVTSNDPAHPVSALQIKGTVWKPIDVIPPVAAFVIPSGVSTNITTVLRLTNRLPAAIALSEPHSNTRAFAAKLQTIRAGKEFQLIVTAVPPFAAGNARGMITLEHFLFR